MNEQERIARMSPPAGRIRLVIDTDAKNEVDDQFAIAWAAASPERFRLEALYAVPFSHDCFNRLNRDQALGDRAGALNGHSESPEDGMRQSRDEIVRILELMNINPDGRVFYGSDRYLENEKEPVASDAARDLVSRCMASQETLYVAAIGALTNIASALLMEPRIREKMVLVWLGGHEVSYGHGIEFNLIQDLYAARIVLDSGLPMIWVPCNNVASHLTVSEAELETYMKGAGPVCDALSAQVLSKFRDPGAEIAMMKLLRTSSLADNTDQDEAYLEQFPTEHVAWSRIIWDVSAIAALKNPNWTPSILAPAPRLSDDFRYLPPMPGAPLIRQVRHCYRNLIFGDLFAALAGK